MTTCQFGSIASRQSVHHDDCTATATYEAVDILAPALERVQRPVCAGHARFLHGQGFWIFPQGDTEAESLNLKDIVDPPEPTEPDTEPDTEVDNERPTLRTLQDLTGFESGAVLFDESHEAIVCNWTNVAGIPRLFAGAVIGLGEELPEVEGEPITDVQELLANYAVVYDATNGEAFSETHATKYDIADGVTVLCFEGWA